MIERYHGVDFSITEDRHLDGRVFRFVSALDEVPLLVVESANGDLAATIDPRDPLSLELAQVDATGDFVAKGQLTDQELLTWSAVVVYGAFLMPELQRAVTRAQAVGQDPARVHELVEQSAFVLGVPESAVKLLRARLLAPAPLRFGDFQWSPSNFPADYHALLRGR